MHGKNTKTVVVIAPRVMGKLFFYLSVRKKTFSRYILNIYKIILAIEFFLLCIVSKQFPRYVYFPWDLTACCGVSVCYTCILPPSPANTLTNDNLTPSSKLDR